MALLLPFGGNTQIQQVVFPRRVGLDTVSNQLIACLQAPAVIAYPDAISKYAARPGVWISCKLDFHDSIKVSI